MYGVFDGHGGKQAATFAAKHIVPVLQEQLVSVPLSSDHQLIQKLEEYKNQLSAKDTATWQAQDTLLAALPGALVTTFSQVQKEFFEHTQVSALRPIYCPCATSLGCSMHLKRISDTDSNHAESLLSGSQGFST